MAMGFSTTLRTNRADQFKLLVDGGPAAGKLKFYDGTRPATGGTATNLLATVTLQDPCGSSAAGVFTLADPGPVTAALSGTATWARFEDSTGAFVADCSVSATGGGGDIQLSSNVLSSGQTVDITGGTITEGNA